MAELLLELFSEEIPAGLQAPAAGDLQKLVATGLEEAGLAFESSQAFSTPRRLTLCIAGLPAVQPDISEERKGPKAGAPDKAIEGFAKSAGLARDELEERDTGKGVYYFAKIERTGGATADVLPAILGAAVAKLSWPKSMRWGGHEVRWIRPLHSILCLFDGEVVPLTFGHLTAGAITRGHPIHVPHAFRVNDFAEYTAYLREAKVILDPAERREMIRAKAQELAAAEGLTLAADEGLLNEVTGLVEWPVVLLGAIDEAYLGLPPEVLTAVMRTHQKYFSLAAPDGALAPRFIMVANTEAEDGGQAIVGGNERVLRARLADAKFFWDQDRKTGLAIRVPALSNVIYFEGLGTETDKTERICALAGEVAPFVLDAIPRPEEFLDLAEFRSVCVEAANLSKADLTTQMVAEFPGLQGVIGRLYALDEGYSSSVADAIRDHRAPQGPNDTCPNVPVSAAVALADKVDALVGLFGVGQRPTGSKDPYGLRRAALGVIRLILENEIRIPLRRLFRQANLIHAQAESGVSWDANDVDLMNFIADRLKVHLREQGVRHDLISAVFALTGEDDLVRLMARVEALGTFLTGEDGANLLTAYKRASNIVRIEEKNDGRTYADAPSAKDFREAEETNLHASLTAAAKASSAAVGKEDFVVAMTELAQLRHPIDHFFDEVTVNCEEPALRANRLRLLSQIRATLDGVADFSQIEG